MTPMDQTSTLRSSANTCEVRNRLARQSEVAQLHADAVALADRQEVVRLHVAVDDAHRVACRDAREHLAEDGLQGRLGLGRHALQGQRQSHAALLHCDVREAFGYKECVHVDNLGRLRQLLDDGDFCPRSSAWPVDRLAQGLLAVEADHLHRNIPRIGDPCSGIDGAEAPFAKLSTENVLFVEAAAKDVLRGV
eukprot:CAMPEP_0176181704 /NCGR_PEP_ID=MMETSP0120_2-20121206/93101_1 /TAXON_ID=160619 /ORGANISM="Kryptoperidinium foliaceum, Strain CCMP 1326" /LENGTH=192 /DNA_ID=CAMNT_0017519935 /DNA_START=78 /DNA_END=652 /DNA_ORIENTATION=+